jgi:hypothetical protein
MLLNERRRFNVALSMLLEEGRATGEFQFGNIEVALQAITGMTTWIFTWYQPASAIPADQVADEIGQLVLQSASANTPQMILSVFDEAVAEDLRQGANGV